MRKLFALMCMVYTMSIFAGERETIWPADKMPDRQEHQIAAMTDEVESGNFEADKHRVPYIEWFAKPDKKVRKGVCMILISGGSYNNCCDVGLIKKWSEELTAIGVQCVNFVYRTPRPKALPIYQTAWEDGQRAVRMVRSEAKKRGFDPEKIGVVGMSAGSHLGLLLATSSQTPAYNRIDKIDDLPCHINWAILNAPAYVTSDAEAGTPASRQGYGVDVTLSKVFKFDSKTCPISFHHGGADVYSPNGSTKAYLQLRRMNIPTELHIYPDKPHGAFGFERAIEFMTQMGYLGKVAEEVDLMSRFTNDDAREKVIVEDVWPEGKMPDEQQGQCKPYMEWHFPKTLKTKAIQIIYSGGAYMRNGTTGFEVAPARRYLNEKGMTVVTMQYRTPRPSKESGLSKFATAWEDLQRCIKIVRSKAAAYGLDANRIGIMGSSAGGHLTLMGVTSSSHQAYLPIDNIDKVPCNVQWGVAIYPAYSLTDGVSDINTGGGNGDDAILVPEYSFDLNTVPTLFLHGDADKHSPMSSVRAWEKMRAMGIQSELHTLATRSHCFQRTASPGTGSYTFLDRIWDFLTAKQYNK